ncbi:MAG TPA: sulfite reductase subunit A [Candidatus Omnitrophica bacterium]|nr:MAG: sulfite reductase subunit A [Omnitrophica WOR_2 bacterium GWF2_63_9]HBH96308.1 sulfite reductase subunit A [Candidatus Omnitrophota bacterium]HBQ37585.1 sulfite reductase subunit A [Candidatus Omnitrophota bacterium]
MTPPSSPSPPVLVTRGDLPALFNALRAKGYQVLGPTVRDGAIAYETLASPDDLPVGWGDAQDAGTYRLVRRKDASLFGYAVGPQSWKQVVFPPRCRLWQATRKPSGTSFQIEPSDDAPPRYAVIGMRSCELHALAIQGRVFLEGPFRDPVYEARRRDLFIVSVQCGQAGGTCFCVSMKTGPSASSGFDLALTELCEPDRHVFLVEVGTARGGEILQAVPHRPATEQEREGARKLLERTARSMGRVMDTDGLKEALEGAADDPHWEAVAQRCLSCANCTMVCPTCFCSAMEDVTDLAGRQAQRMRAWDSCFTLSFSYLHGGSVRSSVTSRYRQWLTHKLAGWIEQFGTSGCVGCGRCITWCPAAIDLTAEVRALRAGASRQVASSNGGEEAAA